MPPKPPKKDVYHGYIDGDIVLCKLKGYPAWPGKVFKRWQGKRPGGAGLWWCVVFFPKGDHYWARAGEMQQLTPIMIERFLESGKRGKDPEMYEGYKIAQDSREWEAKHLTGPHRAYEGPDDSDDGGGHGAVKVPPKTKTKANGSKRARSDSSSGAPPSASGSGSGSGHSKQRAVYVADSGEEEVLDSEDEDEREARRVRKIKRRKESGLTTKLARTAADRPRSSDTSSRHAGSSSVRHVARQIALPASQKTKDRQIEPLADLSQVLKDGAVPTDDDAAMKWVREMRVHMQRNLLDAKPINPGEMHLASQKLRQLEDWDITEDQIKQTKIGKVLSRISNANKVEIPEGDKYNLAQRAKDLLFRWSSLFVNIHFNPATRPEESVSSAVAIAEPQIDLQQGHALQSREEVPEHAQQNAFDGTAMAGQDEWVEEPEKLEREESADILDREYSPEPAVLPCPSAEKGDSIIVTLDENGEDQPTRLDSADLSGCRYFRELLADPNVPRLYEDEENEGELLKTLTLPGWSLADLWLFLHLLVGSDAGKDITDFASLQRALAIERELDAPSVREAVILRLLDRVHADERVAETFALGAAYRSNRLVQASLARFDGKRRAESTLSGPTASRRPRRIRLHSIDPKLYEMIPHALLQDYYELEDRVVSQAYTWAVMAPQFKFLD